MSGYTSFAGTGVPRDSVAPLNNLSARARLAVVAVTGGTFTQNATTLDGAAFTMPFAGILRAAYLAASTKPAGGTLTSTVTAYDASGNAAVVLCDAFDPETLTDREGAALTIAETNVELAAGDTIQLVNTASDDAVTAQAVGLAVTLVLEITETAAQG